MLDNEKVAILILATLNMIAMLADMLQDDHISKTDLLETLLIGINIRQLLTITSTPQA